MLFGFFWSNKLKHWIEFSYSPIRRYDIPLTVRSWSVSFIGVTIWRYFSKNCKYESDSNNEISSLICAVERVELLLLFVVVVVVVVVDVLIGGCDCVWIGRGGGGGGGGGGRTGAEGNVAEILQDCKWFSNSSTFPVHLQLKELFCW